MITNSLTNNQVAIFTGGSCNFEIEDTQVKFCRIELYGIDQAFIDFLFNQLSFTEDYAIERAKEAIWEYYGTEELIDCGYAYPTCEQEDAYQEGDFDSIDVCELEYDQAMLLGYITDKSNWTHSNLLLGVLEIDGTTYYWDTERINDEDDITSLAQQFLKTMPDVLSKLYILSSKHSTNSSIGREGFLDDTNKTEEEELKEIEIQTGVIDNNPVNLHKESYEKNKARIEAA